MARWDWVVHPAFVVVVSTNDPRELGDRVYKVDRKCEWLYARRNWKVRFDGKIFLCELIRSQWDKSIP
jgi:hypothetical protein